jgi:cephalosporin hydroxylase
MEHFYHKIHGWFDFQNIYSGVVNAAPPEGSHFVEVGSWKGTSSAYMAVEIANSGKKIKFDCVDTWLGSPEHQKGDQPEVNQGILFEVFQNNMEPVKDYYTPVRMTSLEASALYEDYSLDFVFIDAAHDTESVTNDIRAWLPKVKVGGYIGGHDYPQETVRIAVTNEIPNHHVSGSSWVFRKEA